MIGWLRRQWWWLRHGHEWDGTPNWAQDHLDHEPGPRRILANDQGTIRESFGFPSWAGPPVFERAPIQPGIADRCRVAYPRSPWFGKTGVVTDLEPGLITAAFVLLAGGPAFPVVIPQGHLAKIESD